MSMGYGYFSIDFYTNDGSPDADAAKRAYDWCMENYDWFKGENGDGSDIPPFLLSGNSFEANDDDYYADGLVIKGTNIPGDVDWLADAAKETKAARLVASVIQDYSESSHWSNGYTEKVWIDGEERHSYGVGEFTRTMADYLPYERDSSIAFRLEEGGFRHSQGKFKNAKTGEIVLGGDLRFWLDDEDYIDTESSLLFFWNSDGRVPIDKDSIDKKECVRAFVSEVKSFMSNDCEIDESDWTFEGFDSQPSFFDIYGKNPPTAPFMDCEDYARKLDVEIDMKNGIFHCTDKRATNVTIPDGFTKIGKEAFRGCKSLASVEIPDSVTEIGKLAFYECESLASVEFGGTAAQWEAVKKGDYWNHGVPATSVKCADVEAALEE
jgi:hypothetical protein